MIDYAQALNEAQYAAAASGDGPVLVVAGAGSGKTRTIVYRLAWLAEHGVAPTSILLLTFTRKAAQEMLQRAGMLLDQGLSGVQGGTFHAFAYGVLRRWRPAWLGERPFTVMDSADITAAVKYCKDELKLGRGDRSFPKTQSIVGLLSKARNKELSLEEVLRREAFHLLPHTEALAVLGEAYTAYRREKGLLDYDDLLFELETLLRENQAAAEALRLEVAQHPVDVGAGDLCVPDPQGRRAECPRGIGEFLSELLEFHFPFLGGCGVAGEARCRQGGRQQAFDCGGFGFHGRSGLCLLYKGKGYALRAVTNPDKRLFISDKACGGWRGRTGRTGRFGAGCGAGSDGMDGDAAGPGRRER